MKKKSVPAVLRAVAARARAIAGQEQSRSRGRIVIAVIGRDRPGILAGVTAILAQRQANIVDVSQTIMSELFTMIMLVEIDRIKGTLGELKRKLERHGREAALSVIIQHEEIFRAMHRI